MVLWLVDSINDDINNFWCNMDSESNKNCLQCQHNITTFLRGDWWSSHLFIFSLISGFEAKIIIPYARYIVNKILCKYWKSFYGQFQVSKGYPILTDTQERGTISQVLTVEILIFVLICRKAREIIVNWFTLLIDLLRYFWYFLMRWLDIKWDKWYNNYVDWYYGYLIALSAIFSSSCMQNRAVSLRINSNIISQPFLEATGWYSHLFIFVKYLISHSSYFIL